MIEGPSGILNVANKDFYPTYEPSKKLITWPNGVKGYIYYAEEPKTIRGPNHGKAWCDEIASWKDAHMGDGDDTAWSNLMLTMRVGEPQVLVTGTPKPLKLVRQILKYPNTIVVRGSTYDNRANLSETFFHNVVDKYAGTRLGRQEIAGEILDDNPGAMWKRDWIETTRIKTLPGDLERIVVAIDPSVAGVLDEDSSGDALPTAGAEAGIIVAGKKGRDFYVFADCSMRGSPDEWGKSGVRQYRFFLADCIVVERNNGGAMIEFLIKTIDDSVNVKTVWASRGKVTRAEPISALYEQKRVHHVGTHEVLEDQLCLWEPGQPSPDRLDALVWALTELAEEDTQVTEGSDEEYESFWNRNHVSLTAPGVFET